MYCKEMKIKINPKNEEMRSFIERIPDDVIRNYNPPPRFGCVMGD